MIRGAIGKITRRQNLSEREMLEVMDEIMSGSATPAQIASFTTALRMKGETVDEIYACAKAMREKADKICAPENAVDTCGTGGDSSGTFNISTTVAFVVAGAGVPIAKHGNRSVSSKSGSADLLEALGVNIGLAPKEVERCVQEIGIGFLFAPTFHKAMRYAVAPRREIGIRTVFNVLGPLTNPADVKYQVLGVYDETLTQTLAHVLKRFGVKHALVVNGSGLDEISTIDKTKVSELKKGKVTTYPITPEPFGIKRAKLEDIMGGSPQENAEITLSVLNGEESAYTDIVLLNAGAALYVAGKSKTMTEGIELAQKAIETGEAKRKLEVLIEWSQKYKGEEK